MLLFLLTALARPLANYEDRKPDAPPPVPELPGDASAEVVHGALLYRVSGCAGCHSPPFKEAQHLGGGRDLPTIFGLFYAPNISPDPEDGIGSWSEQDFFRAMRRGISPKGRRYWPTFPYMAYTNMSDSDIHALWAYLQAQRPVSGKTPKREMAPGYRTPGLIRLWRLLAFKEGPYRPDDSLSEQENRGAYLVKAVAYCDQCHTPRNRQGLLVEEYYLAGGSNPGKGEIHPNLTPHMEKGIGSWSVEDIVRYLSTATRPDGNYADPEQIMYEKVMDSYSYFAEEDKRAIAAYLKSLPPGDFDPSMWSP
jgi:mono/diheme cytochrome c family protein